MSATVLRASTVPRAMAAVYVPTNHLYLGDVFIHPRERLQFPDLTVEEGIRILSRATNLRCIRCQRPLAMRLDRFRIDHLPQDRIIEHLDLGHLVARSEAVKKVHEGHAAGESRSMRDQRQIVSLLHAA